MMSFQLIIAESECPLSTRADIGAVSAFDPTSFAFNWEYPRGTNQRVGAKVIAGTRALSSVEAGGEADWKGPLPTFLAVRAGVQGSVPKPTAATMEPLPSPGWWGRPRA